MNEGKKLSILVPVYNVEQYLPACLDSLLDQSLKDMEIICIDDGSTDSSLQILRQYAERDDRFVVLDGPNGGYGRAMNRGLDAASGEYVGIVEPDDYVASNMYETLYLEARRRELDILKADFYRFTGDLKGTAQFVYHSLSKDAGDYRRVMKPLEERQSFLFLMNTWSGIYRREFLEAHHIRHHESPGASFQDNGFWFQTFVYAERLEILDKPFYRNRRDNPSSSVASSQKIYCANAEYDYIRELFVDNAAVWERVKGILFYKRFHNYLFTLDRIVESARRQYLMDISKEFRKYEAGGEIERVWFSDREWEQLRFIADAPEEYYQLNIAERCHAAELDRIRRSLSYRLGMGMTWLPRSARRWWRQRKAGK